eukprot:m.12369 g.12369  ORF g.12369 m.12369 type:complete len:1566 (-) comp5821_c0_seq1:75-4772(-)
MSCPQSICGAGVLLLLMLGSALAGIDQRLTRTDQDPSQFSDPSAPPSTTPPSPKPPDIELLGALTEEEQACWGIPRRLCGKSTGSYSHCLFVEPKAGCVGWRQALALLSLPCEVFSTAGCAAREDCRIVNDWYCTTDLARATPEPVIALPFSVVGPNIQIISTMQGDNSTKSIDATLDRFTSANVASFSLLSKASKAAYVTRLAEPNPNVLTKHQGSYAHAFTVLTTRLFSWNTIQFSTPFSEFRKDLTSNFGFGCQIDAEADIAIDTPSLTVPSTLDIQKRWLVPPPYNLSVIPEGSAAIAVSVGNNAVGVYEVLPDGTLYCVYFKLAVRPYGVTIMLSVVQDYIQVSQGALEVDTALYSGRTLILTPDHMGMHETGFDGFAGRVSPCLFQSTPLTQERLLAAGAHWADVWCRITYNTSIDPRVHSTSFSTEYSAYEVTAETPFTIPAPALVSDIDTPIPLQYTAATVLPKYISVRPTGEITGNFPRTFTGQQVIDINVDHDTQLANTTYRCLLEDTIVVRVNPPIQLSLPKAIYHAVEGESYFLAFLRDFAASDTEVFRGGTAPFVFELLGTLPEGLSFDPSVPSIHGIAAASDVLQTSSIPLALSVTDAVGTTSSAEFELFVIAPSFPTFITNATAGTTATVNLPQLSNTWGPLGHKVLEATTALSYSFLEPATDDDDAFVGGISASDASRLSDTNSLLHVTAQYPGIHKLTMSVTDPRFVEQRVTLAFRVSSEPVLRYTNASGALASRVPYSCEAATALSDLDKEMTLAVGRPMSMVVPMALSGGQSPWHFNLDALPPGLSFSSERAETVGVVISGTPALPGNYSVCMTVTDSNGAKTSAYVGLVRVLEQDPTAPTTDRLSSRSITSLGVAVGILALSCLVLFILLKRKSRSYKTAAALAPTPIAEKRFDLPRLEWLPPTVLQFQWADITVRAKIGEGSFASVHEGVYQRSVSTGPGGKLLTMLDTHVAVKQYKPHVASDLEVKNELRFLEALRGHPCILFLHAVATGEELHDIWALSELCLGGTLEEYAQTTMSQNIHVGTMLKLLKQVTEGMAFMHSKNIIHRDLASRNILLLANHQVVKIGDFGLAVALHENVGSRTHVPLYCSPPEFLYASTSLIKPTTGASDIWSFGVMLWEVFTGGQPSQAHLAPVLAFPGLLAFFQQRLPPFPLPNIPSVIRALCISCFAYDAGERPTANELTFKLEGLVARFENTTVRPSPIIPASFLLQDSAVEVARRVSASWQIVCENDLGQTTSPEYVQAVRFLQQWTFETSISPLLEPMQQPRYMNSPYWRLSGTQVQLGGVGLPQRPPLAEIPSVATFRRSSVTHLAPPNVDGARQNATILLNGPVPGFSSLSNTRTDSGRGPSGLYHMPSVSMMPATSHHLDLDPSATSSAAVFPHQPLMQSPLSLQQQPPPHLAVYSNTDRRSSASSFQGPTHGSYVVYFATQLTGQPGSLSDDLASDVADQSLHSSRTYLSSSRRMRVATPSVSSCVSDAPGIGTVASETRQFEGSSSSPTQPSRLSSEPSSDHSSGITLESADEPSRLLDTNISIDIDDIPTEV